VLAFDPVTGPPAAIQAPETERIGLRPRGVVLSSGQHDGRLSTLIKAKISKLFDRARTRRTLDYAYERQLEQIQVIRKPRLRNARGAK